MKPNSDFLSLKFTKFSSKCHQVHTTLGGRYMTLDGILYKFISSRYTGKETYKFVQYELKNCTLRGIRRWLTSLRPNISIQNIEEMVYPSVININIDAQYILKVT